MTDSPRALFVLPLAILTGSVGFFCLWTVASNIVSLGGFPFSALYVALLVACAGGWAGGRVAPAVLRSIAQDTPAFDHSPGSVRPWLTAPASRRALLPAMIVIALLLSLAFIVLKSMYWPLWLSVVTCVSVAAWTAVEGRSYADTAAPSASSRSPISRDLYAFTALCALILTAYFFLLNADADDAFYLNLPIGMVANGQALMAHDTMFGPREWPLLMPTYRAESLSTLTALIASLTGISVRIAAHTVLPVIWCINLAATLYVIGTRLFGKHWIAFALFSLVALFALDGSLLSYASHGVVRFFHGKGPLITIVVPLITLFAFMAVRKQEWPTLVALASLQICAVGLTANGIYVGPLALGVSVTASWLSSRNLMNWRTAIPLACAIYPLGVGIYLIVATPPSAVDLMFAPSLLRDLWAQFPVNYLLGLILGCVFLTIYLGGIRSLPRHVLMYVGVVFVLVFNPLLWDFYSRHVTGNLNYRLFWAVPLPSLVAGLLTLFWMFCGKAGRLMVIAVAIGLLAGPASILRASNGTSVVFSPVKIDAPILAAVTRIKDATPKGTRVLAEESLAQWVPTVEQHPYPVVVRDSYLDILLDRIDADDVDRRRRLMRWVSGDPDSLSPQELAALTSELCVGTVVLNVTAPAHARLREMIAGIGGASTTSDAAYELFTLRSSDATCHARRSNLGTNAQPANKELP